jgi:hypothetical protein
MARVNALPIKADADPTEPVHYQMYVADMLTTYDEIFQIIDDKNGSSHSNTISEDHLPTLCEITDAKY